MASRFPDGLRAQLEQRGHLRGDAPRQVIVARRRQVNVIVKGLSARDSPGALSRQGRLRIEESDFGTALGPLTHDRIEPGVGTKPENVRVQRAPKVPPDSTASPTASRQRAVRYRRSACSASISSARR